MVKESERERERELTQIAYDHLRKLKVIFFLVTSTLINNYSSRHTFLRSLPNILPTLHALAV